jgi:transcriptional regulator with XRE-family HTH domain
LPDPLTRPGGDRAAFDADAFYHVLDAERSERGITWKEVAAQTGVSASTLTRLGQGRRPDVDSFARLVAWGGGVHDQPAYLPAQRPQT